MKIINIHEAKTHFSQIVKDVLAGEEIVIAKADKPLVKLTPYSETLTPRRSGQLKGLLKISEDFDTPLPDDLIDSFYQDNDS